MVMHTLIIDPNKKGGGFGKAFAEFYEKYALENNCHYLRIDTNEKNINARNFYKKLGYQEIGILLRIQRNQRRSTRTSWEKI